MPLSERIEKDLVVAMKAREPLKLSTLRMLKSAVKNREIEKGEALDDAGWMKMIQTMIKQRQEAAGQYVKGGRQELADKEEKEIGILREYLPPALGSEEIKKIVSTVKEELAAGGPADMGRVMKETMTRLAGQTVDGKQVSEIVKKLLNP